MRRSLAPRPVLPTALLVGLLAPALLAMAPGAAAQPLPFPVSSEQGGTTFYPNALVVELELQTLAAQHKDIARLHSYGTTSKGLDMWVMEVADFEDPDRVPLAQREVLWVDGGVHATEYSAVMFTMHLLRWLLQGYDPEAPEGEDGAGNATATWIVRNRHTLIAPLANPDGSMTGVNGRLNGNLVNINRNFPVGWADVDESPFSNNPGPYPASEPETQALIAAWARWRPDYYGSVHCCGNLWLYPYGIEGRDPHPDDAPMFARICDEAYAEVREDCGPIWSTIYPASGSTVDTAYEDYGAVAFGFEMSGRDNNRPVTQQAIPELERESWNGVLHAFLHVERYGAYPVARVADVGAEGAAFEVVNEGWANLTQGSVSVVDATGQVRTAALPWLAPGQSAQVAVAGAFGSGAFPVEVQYQKRPLADGWGAVGHTLHVAQGAGSALAGSFVGLEDAVALAASANAETPLPWGLSLLALGMGAALAVRRRHAGR